MLDVDLFAFNTGQQSNCSHFAKHLDKWISKDTRRLNIKYVIIAAIKYCQDF